MTLRGWGQTASPALGTSLAEIMSEQLVASSQRAADRQIAKTEEDDLALALELSRQEALADGFPVDQVDADAELAWRLQQEWQANPGAGNNLQANDDFLVALQMQAKFDHDVLRYESRHGSNERVTVTRGRLHENLAHLRDDLDLNAEVQRIEALSNGAADADVELSDDEDDEYDTKVPATVAAKKEIITKHDIPTTTRRNAKKLETLDVLSGNTVDSKGIRVSNRVFNSLRAHSSKSAPKNTAKMHGKEDIATHQRVLDPRTRLILFRMLDTGELQHLEGIISTGKESNVYGAIASVCDNPEADESEWHAVAAVIKVFKTTLDDFRNRFEYIRDDPRFASRLSKHNAGKLIKVWAEKEMYNLHRMHRANIACPAVLAHRKHVLVMSMIGTDGVPALKLREAADRLSASTMKDLYRQCMLMIRKMYQRARLVHADLSEYNILLHEGKLYFIDVSQAVDITHPRALIYLHRDMSNMRKYFAAHGVAEVLSPLQAITFVLLTMRQQEGAGGAEVEETFGDDPDLEDEEKVEEEEEEEEDYDELAGAAVRLVERSPAAVLADSRQMVDPATGTDEVVALMEQLMPNCWPQGTSRKRQPISEE